jgi:hypothetical protein
MAQNGYKNKTMIMAALDEQNEGKTNLRMWILLVIFLFLAGLFVYDHYHQTNQHLDSKLSNEDRADY